MKITIAPVVAGPAWGSEVSLTTGLDKSPEGIIYNGSSVVDMVEVLDSPEQVPIDRGNQSSVITFRFTSDNSTILASEQDLILYFSTLPRFGKITFYGETELTTPYAYMVGSLNIKHSQIGVATIRDFTITGSPITTDEPLPSGSSAVYLQFMVRVNDNADFCDFVDFITGTGPIASCATIGVYNNNSVTPGTFGFYMQDTHAVVHSTIMTGYVVNTWIMLEMRLQILPTFIRVTPRVNGTAGATFDTTYTELDSFGCGALLSESGTNNHDIAAVRIGTAGWGAGDIFSADFSSTIVPPFDSVTGTGISIISGALNVNNSGTDAYALKSPIL